MKTVTDRLWNAVVEVSKMRYPSVAEILRKRGFGYEADRIGELVAAFDEMEQTRSRAEDAGGQHQPG